MCIMCTQCTAAVKPPAADQLRIVHINAMEKTLAGLQDGNALLDRALFSKGLAKGLVFLVVHPQQLPCLQRSPSCLRVHWCVGVPGFQASKLTATDTHHPQNWKRKGKRRNMGYSEGKRGKGGGGIGENGIQPKVQHFRRRWSVAAKWNGGEGN